MPRRLRLPRARFVIAASFLFWGMTALATAQEAKPVASPFDLSLVPAGAPVVISLRPSALLKLPNLKPLYEEATRADEIKRAVDVADPESIEQVTFILLSRDIPAGNDAGEAIVRNSAVVIRTNKPREWKALAAAAGAPLTKATHDGKDYYKIEGDEAMGFGFYEADPNTLIVATEANLHKFMGMGKVAAPANGIERELTLPDPALGTPLLLATLDFAWIRGLASPALKADPQAALGLSLIGPIWEKTDSVVLGISASETDVTLTADHLCGDEEGAESVKDTVDALLTLGQNMAPEAVKMVQRESKGEPLAAEMAGLGEQVLDSATVEEVSPKVIRFKTTAKMDLARVVRSFSKAK